MAKVKQLRRNPNKPGRNAQCPCGSGKKFKKCCLKQAQEWGYRG